MPPVIPGTKVSLRELADLAIGTPEVGAVNFTTLHTLILAMLKNLNLQETLIDLQTLSPEAGRSLESLRDSSGSQHAPASKERRRSVSRSFSQALENQVQDLTKQLKTMDGKMEDITSHLQYISKASAFHPMDIPEWLVEKEMVMPTLEMAQIKSGKVQKDTVKDRTPKAMKVLQEVVEDVKNLKEAYKKEASAFKPQEVLHRIEDLEKQAKDRDEVLEQLNWKLGVGAEEATMVTWEELEQAIADGWRGSQMSTEQMGLPKRKGPSSITLSDQAPSSASIKHPSPDQTRDSTGVLDQSSESSGHPSEGVSLRERSRGPSATRFLGRAPRDEAGMPKPRQSPSQLRAEAERRRGRETPTSTRPRRDEQDARPGPSQQDLTLARDWHYAYPDQHPGVHISPDDVFEWPDQQRLGPGQLVFPYPSTYARGVVPLGVTQLGELPPEMHYQDLAPLGMDQHGVVPPLVPGRDEQRLGLPGTDQLGMVPGSTDQYDMVLPGTDQRGMEQPGMPERDMGQLGMDQQGLATTGMDQQQRVLPGMDQQGLLLPLTDQHGLISPGLMQVVGDQQGLIQPILEAPGFIQPGTEQYDFIQSGRDQPGLVQPRMVRPGFVQPDSEQHGLVQPGAEQSSLVPPGTDQQGLVRLGIGQRTLVHPGPHRPSLVPPGTAQPGFVPPGAYPHDLVPPGAGQLDVVPSGADQHGLVQRDRDQQGLVHPGMDQYGLAQLGELPSDWVQPGASPSGLVQPGIAQPGIGQRGLVQPGADQYGLTQPGIDQQGLVQPGVDQYGLSQRGVVPPGVGQRGVVPPGVGQRGMGQRGMVPPGVGQPGLAAPDVDQRGLVAPMVDQSVLAVPGVDQPDLAVPGVDQRGLVARGVDQRGMVPPGMYQRGMVPPSLYQRGMVPSGVDRRGMMPPGMDQGGFVPPSVDQGGLVPPGMDQHALVSPDVDQHGMVPPGVDQGGLVPPGMDQQALVSLGMDQRGLVPPGVDRRGLVPPGMGQRAVVAPSVDQRGLVPPGMSQRGLVPPGVDQRGLVPSGVGQGAVAPPGVGQRGLMPPGMDQRGLMPSGVDQGAVVTPGVDQGAIEPPGVDQRDLVAPGVDQPGLVTPGVDQRAVVAPGVDQRGLVPPGMDQRGLMPSRVDQGAVVPPGVGQRGLVPPGMVQRGFMPPGMGQRVLLQPSTEPRGMVHPGRYVSGLAQPREHPPGLVQPDAYPPGFFQPGVYPGGLTQPIVYPRGVVWPGMDQRDSRQPGADWQGVMAPGTEPRGFPTLQRDPRGLMSLRPHLPGVGPPGREPRGQALSLLPSQGLASPIVDQKGLVSPETYQQGLMHPGLDQRGQAPDGQLSVSSGPDQQGQGYPSAGQQDRAYSVSDSGGPGYPGIGPHDQEYLDPNRTSDSQQPGHPAQRAPVQHIPSFASQDSERSEVRSDRHDSLEKLAPSFPMAVETFRLMGEIISLYVELKERMKDLDEEKAGQSDLEKIQYLLALMVQKTIPPDLQEQLKSIKTLAKEVRQERAQLNKLQRLLEGDSEREAGKELKTSQLGLQLGIIRVTVADIEKELSELRESQERGKTAMENSVSEASLYLQDQLDKLRIIIESMLASSSTLLSMSMTPHKPLTSMAPGQIDPHATCPACSLDLSHQVSTLVQRYEQLQDMVNNLAASRPSKKAKLQSQDEELLGHVQTAILQVQGDCEKLNITTSNLIEDHHQKQKDIDMLYQGLEKLEKEKANREHLEMEIDVKADKSALAAKVSRVQFDATTEQLTHMMQELVAKMSGQEQDWQKMLDKLLVEMDSKLDRLELDPVKQLLEDRWRSLRKQLKERPPLYQADEAAAMRRQLLAHFHCLSCDRPLETPVTGQTIPLIPVGPGLPGHRSVRPYTIFELEQVRQQSRNLKLGSTFCRGDLSPMERSAGRLRTMHSKMLMDIEKVQIHFGGSVKASSQMIHELLQAQGLTSPCYKRVPDAMVDYTYSTVPRRCGGSHTLTYPYRRSRQQHVTQGLLAPAPEEIQIAMKHDEVDILGLDGHIYKGRMDTRLPGILNKDTSGVSKHKTKQPRPHLPRQQVLGDISQLPSRPQSAQQLAGNNSVSSRQQKDRPVSSEAQLSQSNMAHPPSPTEMEPPQDTSSGLGTHMDLPPEEELEEPTRGPRSTAAP